MNWKKNIDEFIKLVNEHKVRMIMVGGGAVNFHGYQRHSADVDFWIETTNENLNKLITVFNAMGYDINSFPKEVKTQMQNISVKFSPEDLDLELITRFSISKSFNEAYDESEEVEVKGQNFLRWRVLGLDDLILSKIKAGRPKDLLDIQQLQKIKNN
jgi:predicted nucleotidyltransferase